MARSKYQVHHVDDQFYSVHRHGARTHLLVLNEDGYSWDLIPVDFFSGTIRHNCTDTYETILQAFAALQILGDLEFVHESP